jgi:hypothetical protein
MLESSSPQQNERDRLSNSTISIRNAIIYAEKDADEEPTIAVFVY